ncbi:cyclic nucleotide-binding domain-containing protein [Methyloligella halotolerans]|uniref:cyclic nucleotide-binding domain-containing protein n=1 Tax=Methyloligella halotolerans TaxID=1177755 RepID=UPI003CC9CF65
MSESAVDILRPHLQRIDWGPQQPILNPGDTITDVYFPESAVLSLVSPASDGRVPELASIGREGIAGCVSAIGSGTTFSQWVAQVPGRALQCPASAFEAAFDQSQASGRPRSATWRRCNARSCSRSPATPCTRWKRGAAAGF